MTQKETYFLRLSDTDKNINGIGECAVFRGLGADDKPDYEQQLAALCHNINRHGLPQQNYIHPYSSIQFGLETAMRELNFGGGFMVADTAWSNSETAITINGLVWMGEADEMLARIDSKLRDGFKCIKLKIGGIDFTQEINLLKYIRESYDTNELEIRLDANGAFSPANALERLDQLAKYDIHSIEQPIKQKQWQTMSAICAKSPIAIALDEELIGIGDNSNKEAMLDTIQPAYIILKPSLCGGLASSDEWIRLATDRQIGWWATSALESNVGLNAIAQWVSTYDIEMQQGLGTGQLYTNNIESPLLLTGDKLHYNDINKWHVPEMDWIEP